MKLNILHSILLLINVILASIVTFDWTSLGLSATTAGEVSGAIIMASTIVTGLLNWGGKAATGIVQPKK